MVTVGREKPPGRSNGASVMPHDGATVSGTADVAASARLGAGTRVWHLAQVGEDAVLGRSCVVGRGAYIGPTVVVGDHVKIQNYALVYQPATLGDGVFVGPAAVLTNDLHPRAVDVTGRPKAAGDWTPVAVHVREGASLGARSVCVAPVTVGRWAMVGAGAVVVADVPDFALVVGVPARRVGWVGRAGSPLVRGDDGIWHCETTGDRYAERGGALYELRTRA
jgi:UDP-2-acetamido-3-amino-2,3-dideoxy-glucuronate N-acetyltransferase